MIVARAGHRHPQQILIFIHSFDDGTQKEQELRVFLGGFSGIEEVLTEVRGERPVVVFARAVDAGKRFFVEEAGHAVAFSHFFHHLHGDLVVIGGDVGIGKDGGQLMLGGRDFVVFGLGQHPHFPQFFVELLHIGYYAGTDGAEVMVLQLLALGGHGAEQGAAGIFQILAEVKQFFIDQEVFLFGADGGDHPGGRIAKKFEDAQGFPVEDLHGAEQGGLFVQDLSAVRTKSGGDAKDAVLDEGIGGGVPGGIAPGFESGAQTAGGEGRGVRLAPDEFLAGKFHDNPAVPGGVDKAVMLFGGDAGHGLEPVGKMGDPLGDGPILHGVGHGVGQIQIEGHSRVDGLAQRLVDILGQTFPHHLVVKDQTAEQLGHIAHSFSTSCIYKNFQAKEKRRRSGCRFDSHARASCAAVPIRNGSAPRTRNYVSYYKTFGAGKSILF